MAISTCPKCIEKVSIPNGGSPQSRVRCPLCQEEYSLGEALDMMPPALILLDAPQANMPLSSAPSYSSYRPVPAYNAGAALGGGQEDGSDFFEEFPSSAGVATATADADEMELEPLGQDSATATEEAPTPKKIRQTKVKKKKPKNPLMEGVKIVGGGVIGIAFAILFLFWIPGDWKRQQRDPLSISTKVAQYAPFLVPEQLREPPAPPQKKGSGGSNGNRLATKGGESQVAGNSGLGMPGGAPPAKPKDEFNLNDGLGLEAPKDNGLGQAGFDLKVPDPNLPGTDLEEPKPKPQKPKNQKKNPPAPLKDDVDPFSLGGDTAKPANVDVPKPEPATLPPDEPKVVKPVPTPNAKPLLKNPPAVTEEGLEPVKVAMQAATEAWTNSEGASREEQRALAVAFYSSLAKVSETAVALHASGKLSPPIVSELRSAVAKICAAEKNSKILDSFTGRWLDDAQRANTGVVLQGTVKNVSPLGKLMMTEMELSTKDQRMVTVIGAIEPSYQVGQKILVPGIVIENPTDMIEGYDGPGQLVIFSELGFAPTAAE